MEFLNKYVSPNPGQSIVLMNKKKNLALLFQQTIDLKKAKTGQIFGSWRSTRITGKQHRKDAGRSDKKSRPSKLQDCYDQLRNLEESSNFKETLV